MCLSGFIYLTAVNVNIVKFYSVNSVKLSQARSMDF